jgi:hypothetical protein
MTKLGIRLRKLTAVLVLLAITVGLLLVSENLNQVPQTIVPSTKQEPSVLIQRPATYPFMCGVDQSEDPELVRYVKENVLIPPSKEEYNFTNPQIKDASKFDLISKVVIPNFFANVSRNVTFHKPQSKIMIQTDKL